ncbi:hypothetical protein RP20_CCG012004 [Aedes albopictus]|nr:hypothetical protein RP20_CCG012004 [Aedes albopictus]
MHLKLWVSLGALLLVLAVTPSGGESACNCVDCPVDCSCGCKEPALERAKRDDEDDGVKVEVLPVGNDDAADSNGGSASDPEPKPPGRARPGPGPRRPGPGPGPGPRGQRRRQEQQPVEDMETS